MNSEINIISGKLILPKDFGDVDNSVFNTLKQEIIDLEKSIEDLDNITGKQLKEASKKIEDKKVELNNFKSLKNKYGYEFTNNIDEFYGDASNGVFSIDKNKNIYMITSDGELAKFSLNNIDVYELVNKGLTDSRHGWVGEIYIDLAKKFKSTISFEEISEDGDTNIINVINDEIIGKENMKKQIIQVLDNFKLKNQTKKEVLKELSLL